MPQDALKLWAPDPIKMRESHMWRFMSSIEKKYNLNFKGDYHMLHQWSVDNINECWKEIWEYVGIKASRKFTTAVHYRTILDAVWFPDARLNFAENLLKIQTKKTAIIGYREDGVACRITYKQLYTAVGALGAALRKMGVRSGDRVAGVVSNGWESVVGMLAVLSIGAVWSSCSPDFGVTSIVDRFGQISPKVILVADRYSFKGRTYDCLPRVAELVTKIPSVEHIVVIEYDPLNPVDISSIPNAVRFEEIQRANKGAQPVFEQVSFDHPALIMFSSGTTGLPKCIVQGTGVLINHMKELKLHQDIDNQSIVFILTTTSWMMWNWLVSSLAMNCTIVLYDGNFFFPSHSSILDIVSREKVTVFGTGAKFWGVMEQEKIHPMKQGLDLSALRVISSTGSTLPPEGFDYIYREIKRDVMLCSNSGGTELNGCFAIGNPILPIFRGELQCRGLAMAMEVFTETGQSVTRQKGELVCTKPFPSMPLYFWNDDGGKKYHKAYFGVFPLVWHHGDFAEITKNNGVIIYGRSDTTLNVGGVRMGSSDFYRVVDQFTDIADSVVVSQPLDKTGAEERILLFVKMQPGKHLTSKLMSDIQAKCKSELSPRHFPALIIAVPDIPYTATMKKVEIAVRKTIMGEEVTNRGALLNPKSLDFFAGIVPVLAKL